MIAAGSTRQLTESGCRIDLGSETRHVYDVRRTAEISYELRGADITITLDTLTLVE